MNKFFFFKVRTAFSYFDENLNKSDIITSGDSPCWGCYEYLELFPGWSEEIWALRMSKVNLAEKRTYSMSSSVSWNQDGCKVCRIKERCLKWSGRKRDHPWKYSTCLRPCWKQLQKTELWCRNLVLWCRLLMWQILIDYETLKGCSYLKSIFKDWLDWEPEI